MERTHIEQNMQRQKATSACQECRTRKIRCIDAESGICANCHKLQLQCVARGDGRKDRYRSQKIERLEQEVAGYQRLFQQLKEANTKTTNLLKAMGRLPRPDASDEPGLISPTTKPVVLRAERTYFSQQGFPKKKTYVPTFGPTSVLDAEESVPRQHAAEIRQLREKPHVIECIRLFFRWQYPDMHSFVFREAFLIDFFEENSPGVYSSTELVYALCCIGGSMSENNELRALAGSFYQNAREMLMSSLDSPCIVSLQAYMLLGLYDIYNANINSGWMLTGDAIRVGYGIGFHLRPENWLLGEESSLQNNEITNSVRSRIFWGTFAADRFISLILGRRSVIRVDESTIPIAANMPALEWIEPYTYPGAPEDDKTPYIDISNPLLNIIKLAKISDEMMENVFSKGINGGGNTSDPDLGEKLDLVNTYNKKLFLWREELPDNMKWDRTMLREKGHNNNKMFLRYFYYMVLLCLNRPFVDVKVRPESKDSPDSSDVCMEIIEDLHCSIYCFLKLNGASKCSVLIVYSCIISLSVLLMSSNGDSWGTKNRFFYEFMLVLKHCSHWRLSSVSYNKLKTKFEEMSKIPFDNALAQYAEQVRHDDNSVFWTLQNDGKMHWEKPGTGATLPLELRSGDGEFSSFGGPPVFMTSDVSDWTDLFPEMLERR